MAKIEAPDPIKKVAFLDVYGREVDVVHVGDVVKTIIAEKYQGKHRKGVAEAVGVPQQTFNEWCNDPERYPDYESLTKIIHNMGLKPHRFFALYKPYVHRDPAHLEMNLDAIGAHLQTPANAELLIRILEHLESKGELERTLEFWADGYGVRPQPRNVISLKRSKKNRTTS